jgi:hypothetical protein
MQTPKPRPEEIAKLKAAALDLSQMSDSAAPRARGICSLHVAIRIK